MTKPDMDSVKKALHPLERKVLPHLKDGLDFKELVQASGLQEVETMRALQWLQSKEVLSIKETVSEVVSAGENGQKALQTDFPEKLFLRTIINGPKNIDLIMKDTVLNRDEINACIGLLRGKGLIEIKPGMEMHITPAGKVYVNKVTPEESLLRAAKAKEVNVDSLNTSEKAAFEALKRRKGMVTTSIKKTWSVELRDFGRDLIASGLDFQDTIDRLTPEMLRNGTWKDKEFRSYDLNSPTPRAGRGKRHFVNQAIRSAKDIWLEMGFCEMTGPMLQTSFWNFDALFTAQDHPVREMQDTFFIKMPAKGKLPDKKLANAVRKTHETGGDTGSKGWQYRWDEEEAKKNVLRTHTTCLSARTLSKLSQKDMPAKYFSVGKCFRNETLDWSHLFEFNQTEGIVIDRQATFRHLIGYLKAFFRKMGYENARFRPAYFPYTEFSVEIDVFHPVHKKWFELGGAGIFRPEVVKPILGADVPVLAWGPGFDRIIIEYFKITDIRELYKNDLKQLREVKEWMRL